jgi:hypothetical protein
MSSWLVSDEAWPNHLAGAAKSALFNFVPQHIWGLLLLPWGLLVVLQYGAIDGSHFLQLVRVFLKRKNF